MDTQRLIRYGELATPGFVVGFIAGAVAGGLATVVGQPVGWALVGTVALGLPLGIFGAMYGLFSALGKVRIAAFAPMALFWLFAFPVSRFIHEVGTPVLLGGEFQLPDDTLGFFLFQAILSTGFAFGFLWLHERIAPRYWRRIADRNPEAAAIYGAYAAYAKKVYDAREARRRKNQSEQRRAHDKTDAHDKTKTKAKGKAG